MNILPSLRGRIRPVLGAALLAATAGASAAELGANVQGLLDAARSQNPNSADSQFFICFADAQFLNGQYTVWGQVIEGMENVDKVAVGEPPANPTKMTKVRLQSDL